MENIRLKYVREVRMGIDAKNLLALDWIVWTLSDNKFDCRNHQNIKCKNNNDQSIWSYNFQEIISYDLFGQGKVNDEHALCSFCLFESLLSTSNGS